MVSFLFSVKEEKLAKEKEEGKPEKKKRRVVRKKQPTGPSHSAGEAIEKMLQGKKISSKINYEVLKSLSAAPTKTDVSGEIGVDSSETTATEETVERYVWNVWYF